MLGIYNLARGTIKIVNVKFNYLNSYAIESKCIRAGVLLNALLLGKGLGVQMARELVLLR